MVGGLGLSAYRALSRRGAESRYIPSAQRPAGPLIWLHAPEPGGADTAANLARRLITTRPGTTVLLTTGETEVDTLKAICPLHDVVPHDQPTSAMDFVEHWSPDVALWLWGDIRPHLVEATHKAGVPLLLANAGEDGFGTRGGRWRRDPSQTALPKFQKVITRSDAATARLASLGCPHTQLEQCAPLQSSAVALPYVQPDFDELAAVLRGRPVWCAAAVQPAEVRIVLDAHRHATRLSHRLLLALNPADPSQEADCITALKDQGLRYANWDDGAFPDDNCQVLLAASKGELGLWYRIAPVSFLGSSLSTGKGGLDPMQAAGLGSAVLYGPNIRNHLSAYSRLASAGAARTVNDANALGVAVARLIAPDHAATMALAGWEVASESAAVTDRIVDLVQDALDQRQSKGDLDART